MDKVAYTTCRVGKNNGYSLVLESERCLDMRIIANYAKRENVSFSALAIPGLSFPDKKELEEILGDSGDSCKRDGIIFRVAKKEGYVFVKEYGKYKTLKPVINAAKKENWLYSQIGTASLTPVERENFKKEMKK